MFASSDNSSTFGRSWLISLLRRLAESPAVLVPEKPFWFQLSFSIALVMLATLFRYIFGTAFGITSVFLLYHPAVLIAAWYGRLRAGLLTTLLSILVATLLWAEPRAVDLQLDDWVTLSIFLAIGVFQCFLIDILQRAVLAQKRAKEELNMARERLRHHAEELEAKVQERTLMLRQSVVELQELSYTLVHDLRAPLRAMRSFAEIVTQDHSEKMDEAAREYLKRIMDAALRMDDLIRDVLAYSGVVGQPITIEAVDLEKLVDAVIRDYPQVQMKHATFSVIRPLHPVMANPSLVVQCLSNLLTNAVKFVAPGAQAKIRIWTEQRDDYIRLNIQDNGLGIPSTLHTKIFEPFQKGHVDFDTPGHGIGLAIVKKAVERMKGGIGLQSEPKKGSTFWVELPAVTQMPEIGSESALMNSVQDEVKKRGPELNPGLHNR